MINVQREITLRAIELLLLPPDQMSLILDIGCGSGLSGQVLEEQGHVWVGCDVSRDMLQVAHERIKDSFEKRGNEGMKDDSDDEDEDDDIPSTGDVMHHVSFRLLSNNGYTHTHTHTHSESVPHANYLQNNRTWEVVYPFVQRPLMLVFLFRLFSGCATVTRHLKIPNGDSFASFQACIPS